MISFREYKSFSVYLTLFFFLFLSCGCSYKPSYLQKSESTRVSERWKVVKIDPSRLSTDELTVYEKMGPPTYLRFFRHLSVDRVKIYEWIYAEPVQLFTFIDGKKSDYVVLDDNPSALNEAEKKILLWTGIIAGSVAVAGGAYYYFTNK